VPISGTQAEKVEIRKIVNTVKEPEKTPNTVEG
jgi:hypothetical protein